MASRQPHSKSRRGCTQCKARRIKCDEVKPTCLNCSRAAMHCSFLRAVPRLPLSFAQPLALDSPASPRGRAMNILEFTAHDLQLLHHFTVSTSHTLLPCRNNHRLWRTTIIHLAFKHDFLLRGIMALSALHMSYANRTNRELLAISQRHRDAAVASSRLELSNITPANCHALFAFSQLLYVHTFATSPKDNLSGSSELTCDTSQLLSWQWVRMARGVAAVLDASFQWIQQGPLSTMLRFNPGTENSPACLQALQRVDTRLSGLEHTWVQHSASCRTDHQEALAYSEALSRLRLAYTYTYSAWFKADNGASVAGPVFMWLYQVPADYITFLEAENAEALLIFAYYAVLLGILPKCWWSKGRASRVVESIRSVLDEKWHHWLDWPMEELDRLRASQVA